MRIQSLVLVAMGTFVSSASFATVQPYLPFQFKDQSLYSRRDIRDKIHALQAPASAQAHTVVAELDTSDVIVRMGSETAALLDRATRPVAPKVEQYAPLCEMLQDFDAGAFKRAATKDANCQASHAIIASNLAGVREACLNVRHPDAYLYNQPKTKANGAAVTNIENLIRTAAVPLASMGFPRPLFPDDFTEKLRTVLLKLRAQEFRAPLQQAVARAEQARVDIEQQGDCYASTHPAHTASTVAKEASAALAYLNQVEAEGVQQAIADRDAVRAKGRTRADLPYPSLTDQEREFISFYFGGTYWRMRGGGLVRGDHKGTSGNRQYFNLVPMRVLIQMSGGNEAVGAADPLYSAVHHGWADWMDMGRTPGAEDRYYDLVYMTRRGVEQVEGAMSFLQRGGWDATDLYIGGLQMGVNYYFAWDRLMGVQLGMGQEEPYTNFIDGPTSWGEFCAGGGIYLGLAKSLLNGKNANQKPPRRWFLDAAGFNEVGM